MLEGFIYSTNIIVSIIGFLSCFYILMNSTLNKKTARCVVTTCLAGLVWFAFLYLSLLHVYQVTLIELLWKATMLDITLCWISNNYYNKKSTIK